MDEIRVKAKQNYPEGMKYIKIYAIKHGIYQSIYADMLNTKGYLQPTEKIL